MKKIVAIYASPRTVWNTSTLVREVAMGAEAVFPQEKQKAFSLGAEMAGDPWDN